MIKIKKILLCLILSIVIIFGNTNNVFANDQVIHGSTTGTLPQILGPTGPTDNPGVTGDGGGSPWFLIPGPPGTIYLVYSTIVGGNCTMTGSYCSPQAYLGDTDFDIVYNVFDLYVARVEEYYFICEKTIKGYRDIFTRENLIYADKTLKSFILLSSREYTMNKQL